MPNNVKNLIVILLIGLAVLTIVYKYLKHKVKFPQNFTLKCPSSEYTTSYYKQDGKYYITQEGGGGEISEDLFQSVYREHKNNPKSSGTRCSFISEGGAMGHAS